MRLLPFTFGLLAVAGLAACSPKPVEKPPVAAPEAPQAVAPKDFPAGDYKLDKSHASLTFTVNHTGFSTYTAGFDAFDAHLTIDPSAPEAAKLTASVDVKSLDLPTPPTGFHDSLMGAQWFDAAKYPQMTFVSTKVEKTGDFTAKIYGDLTLHGVTKPVVLDATLNGGYAGFAPYDPAARVGFSAKGTIKRSDFGISYGIPAPGTVMGVGDSVGIAIEAEFSGPPLKAEK
ncbi:YceI family protein [Asticcacaulis sp. YBE204]|uniref:YceI family protein n=1 Tax=Asticcacaulis sp. YBE204 TaxID=1282363 RepID=UPI0003C40546|nr:YceI family protein [Asticcacaulis sp. YBE204]ESQ81041.1 hypothetical protein AEYBE204_01565 [Asticcacaulis sp. YBE204]